MATAGHPIVFTVKSCKGKALAQIYLHKQLQRLRRSDQWTMLGYDGNSELAEHLALKYHSGHPSAIDNELLSQLCFADLQNWKNLCLQGEQAIKLLGEVLDSGELDEQGSELLDWVMMDYCRESGKANKCRRCLLCRKVANLAILVPKSTALEAESIVSLHSFVHFERSQTVFRFCRECELVLSIYGSELILFRLSDEHVPVLLNPADCIHGRPVTYGRVFYLHLIAKLAQKLPLAYTGYCSNWKDIYNTFVACRQIFLSSDINNCTIKFPKVYLFPNPNTWYVFMDPSSDFCSFSFSKNATAMITSKQSIDKKGNASQFQFFMMHNDGCSIMVDFKSEECVQLPSQYLINPAGGCYLLPHLKERWEAFPQELVQGFCTLALVDERRSVYQQILRLEGIDFSNAQLRSTRFWLPKKLFLSLLPEEFSLEVDSDTIRNIILPDGHKILCHSHDQNKNLTIFLACATNSMGQKKQFFIIFTCKLYNYFIAAGVFLRGDTTEIINPLMFQLDEEVKCVYQLLFQKFPPRLLDNLLRQMLVSYGNFGFEAVTAYEEITR